MGKKKFIDRKQSATYRLVFKDSSSATGGDAADRVFVRVDGGDSFVPGFDSETEEGNDGFVHDARAAAFISDDTRQEMIELGFPDDGYNYLQHLREIGPSGRIGSFVQASRVRLDMLRPDVQAFNASNVHVPLSEEESERNALKVGEGARRIRGHVSKFVDTDVAALLEKEDNMSLVSGDELEDNFVALANVGGDDSSIEETDSEDDNYLFLKSKYEGLDAEEKCEGGYNEELERPARLLDEQFELLALREYDDEEIGELDEDDISTRGPAHISAFRSVIDDSICIHDKYKTPVELQTGMVDGMPQLELIENVQSAKESCSLLMPVVDKESILASASLDERVSSDEKELVFGSDYNSDEARWDCESIVTTYSNLDNHPGMICSLPKVMGASLKKTEDNQSMIRLRGKQQLPVDYLPKRHSLQKDEKIEGHHQEETVKLVKKRAETKEEKKARKVAVKEDKRSARASKKGMKLVYKDESQRAQRIAASTGPAAFHL